MKFEKIVELIGKAAGKHLIVRRRSQVNSTFKLYNTYTIEIWKNVGDDFKILLSVLDTFRNPDSGIRIESLEEQAVEQLLNMKNGV